MNEQFEFIDIDDNYTIKGLSELYGYSIRRMQEIVKELNVGIKVKGVVRVPKHNMNKLIEYLNEKGNAGNATISATSASVSNNNMSLLSQKIFQSTTLKELQKIYPVEQLRQLINYIVGFKPEITQVNNEVKLLEIPNEIETIDYNEKLTSSQCRKIQKAVQEVSNKKQKEYKYLYGMIKDRYSIPTYKDLKQQYFSDCLHYLYNVL